MILSRRVLIQSGIAVSAGAAACSSLDAEVAKTRTTSLINGRWFNGTSFEPRTGWSAGGRFTFQQPQRVKTTIDLRGAFLIPPFADAHNHGIGTGVEARDLAMVDAYLRAGVFYARSMGNLPLSASDKARLGLNTPRGLDAIFAQGSITGYGGHPAGIIRNVLLPQGYFPGHTPETLRDVRFFEIASEAELQAKWKTIRAAHGDLIKFFLFNSDEYAARKDDPAFFGRRGLDPILAASVVRMAHADKLRAAAHVVNVADFRSALDSGVDILAHLPAEGLLTPEDAKRVARQRVEVTTTCGFLTRLARNSPEESAAIASRQRPNLKLLKDAGAILAVGSDDPADPTQGEVAHLRNLGVFSDLELLRMWSGATARSIYPGRRIGALEEGYEASFLALEDDPTVDWSATGRILMRFKQGVELPTTAGGL